MEVSILLINLKMLSCILGVLCKRAEMTWDRHYTTLGVLTTNLESLLLLSDARHKSVRLPLSKIRSHTQPMIQPSVVIASVGW